jgi:cellulose synthase/poly-beta-1,6-N-acetylglucosamine synthase-like glycosyltransferase
MIDVLVMISVFLYSMALLFVLFHSLFDAHLIFHYLRTSPKNNAQVYNETNIPFVTIQLPVYNELYVVERLLDAVASLDYPVDKFEIQVLDDSTDETSDIITKKICSLQQKNIPVYHIRRQNRDVAAKFSETFGETLDPFKTQNLLPSTSFPKASILLLSISRRYKFPSSSPS